MATAGERIPVLVTAMEKAQIARMAKAAGVSMGEFLRRAASSYRSSADDEVERMAATMVTQQPKLESLTERVIRQETALEIGLARAGNKKPARRIEHKS